MSELGSGEPPSPGWKRFVDKVTSRLPRRTQPTPGFNSPPEPNTSLQGLGVEGKPNPESITPRDALEKLTRVHDLNILDTMRKAEQDAPTSVIHLMEGGIDPLMARINFGKRNAPRFQSWDHLMSEVGRNLEVHPGEDIDDTPIYPEGDGFITPHYITPEEWRKIDYHFGRGALTSAESITLVGDTFQAEAQKAMSGELTVLGMGIVRKEILPGVTLEVEVVDDSHWAMTVPAYADRLAGQEHNKYKTVGSYGDVPLVGETPLTGKGLLAHTVDPYKDDFRARYEPILSGTSPVEAQLFYGDPSDWDIEGLVAHIVDVKKAQGVAVDTENKNLTEFVTDPNYFSRDTRLYLLARMEYVLFKAGRNISFSNDLDIDHQIASVVNMYQAYKTEQRDASQKENLALLRKIMNRESVSPMTEEERERVVQRNLELLEHDLVKETPYWELDENTNRAKNGILHKGRRSPQEGTMETGLAVTYETATGRIMPIPRDKEFLPGDYSRLATWVTNVGRNMERQEENGKTVRWVMTETGTNTIALVQPGESPTISEMDRAVRGEGSEAPKEANRRLLPERIDPREDYRTFMGTRVQWRQSVWNESAEGDQAFLRSLQLFNQRFGLQR